MNLRSILSKTINHYSTKRMSGAEGEIRTRELLPSLLAMVVTISGAMNLGYYSSKSCFAMKPPLAKMPRRPNGPKSKSCDLNLISIR